MKISGPLMRYISCSPNSSLNLNDWHGKQREVWAVRLADGKEILTVV